MPHSRWNDIPEEALAACGYRLLTRLKNGMADAFMRQEKQHLAVFFQGHPEYDAASLLLEYRRDIRRFLNRERTTYPSMPQGYFDEGVAAAWTALKLRALSAGRHEQPSAAVFPAVARPGRGQNWWRAEALQLYRNWLHYVCEQKRKQLESRPPDADYRFEAALSVAAAPERLLPEAEADDGRAQYTV
jgi:homoserine O-succinyltransferase